MVFVGSVSSLTVLSGTGVCLVTDGVLAPGRTEEPARNRVQERLSSDPLITGITG